MQPKISPVSYAQLQPDALAEVTGVDLVLGASEKFKLTKYLNDLTKKETGVVHSCEIDSVTQYTSSFSTSDRTRAFLKVQDGCDYKCTYCTIPLARGISRSDALENVLANAKLVHLNSDYVVRNIKKNKPSILDLFNILK